MSEATPVAGAEGRRLDLDWLRIGAFATLILYHVGMFYVPWDWHVKSPRQIDELVWPMSFFSPWRLTLLFLVSGAATRYLADKLPLGRFAWARFWRLFPPLLLAVFVVVPPQSYYEIVEKIAYAGGPTAFYRGYVTASGGWCRNGECLITPTYNHLWFVAYLLVYTLLLAALLKLARPAFGRMQAGVERGLAGAGALLWPMLWLVLIRLVLLPRFEITHALIDDWYNHALSLSAFLLGFLIVKSPAVWVALERWRWTALTIGIAAFALYGPYVWTFRAEDATPPEDLRRLMRLVGGVDQWAWIAAALGFASRYLRRADGPVRRYLTEAIFPFYIVHQTVTVVAGHHLAKLRLPLGLEFVLLAAITFGGCVLAFELVRRVKWLRPWFGLKMHDSRGLAREPRPA
ncbi:MAG TPA: acyltransferase family protein [Caulobacteraceae bacterium]|jgi:peptidoglycan/LPS O-acetylase OafA/YrhL